MSPSPDTETPETPAARRDLAGGIDPAALERARIFRAAGDAPRLRLLDALMQGERSVSDLAELVGAGLSTVSQQLRVLRSEDLVTTRREGKRIYYSLADHHVTQLIESALAHALEAR